MSDNIVLLISEEIDKEVQALREVVDLPTIVTVAGNVITVEVGHESVCRIDCSLNSPFPLTLRRGPTMEDTSARYFETDEKSLYRLTSRAGQMINSCPKVVAELAKYR